MSTKRRQIFSANDLVPPRQLSSEVRCGECQSQGRLMHRTLGVVSTSSDRPGEVLFLKRLQRSVPPNSDIIVPGFGRWPFHNAPLQPRGLPEWCRCGAGHRVLVTRRKLLVGLRLASGGVVYVRREIHDDTEAAASQGFRLDPPAPFWVLSSPVA